MEGACLSQTLAARSALAQYHGEGSPWEELTMSSLPIRAGVIHRDYATLSMRRSITLLIRTEVTHRLEHVPKTLLIRTEMTHRVKHVPKTLLIRTEVTHRVEHVPGHGFGE